MTKRMSPKLFLKTRHTDVNCENACGFTTLIIAAEARCHSEVVDILLGRKELNVNHTTLDIDTALLVVSSNGYVEKVQAMPCWPITI